MENHLANTYLRLAIQFERGDGVYLYDPNGERYLDAYSGIAVTGLGHNNPAVTKAIQEQAAKIIHASNLVEIQQQVDLGDVLANLFGADSEVFFNNSGAEAIETAIKIARLYGHSKQIANPKILVMHGAFHGRTIAAITAGDNQKSKEGFDPLLPGFIRVAYDNPAAIETALKADPEIVAVLLEPIQGESGIRVPNQNYLSQIRNICDDTQTLMMLDEVQSGMARTGKFFCFEHASIQPDVVTLAKGLANGVPIGACIIRKPYCDLFKPGSHGSTFGGNPLSCAAALATIKEIVNNKLYENAARQGTKIIAGLSAALSANPHVKAVRGQGLMIGVELDQPCREILPIALKHRIIFNVANYNVLRIMPPLIINDTEAQTIIDVIPTLINEYYAKIS